ncbi:hypothetical protein BH23VER1_BH23VER1_13790 [soil metagenome]
MSLSPQVSYSAPTNQPTYDPIDPTLHRFAERVLFSTSLEEKLAPPPARLADHRRGAAIATPDSPGRPESLRLGRGRRPPFPAISDITDGAQRGRLLHFFANHELLATELMALVLLKFPDAPAEFRAGVLRTLRDEQMHTKLYLRRMAECGVHFGDLPVNGFFWKSVAPMPTPADYVARLSLTFEQANLDYSRGYAQVFAAAGDPATAALLERIYHDEIAHVGYGLQWFRKWKADPARSDWDAYRARLSLPLSPARAKGKGTFAFDEGGRRAAGLTPDFIRELKVYSRSKGRTPNVYSFNPGAEAAALDPNKTPDPATQAAARDLAILPAFLARAEDVALVPDIPPTAHLESLLEAGLELPEFVAVRDLPELLASRKLNAFRPWARTPDALTPIDSATPPALFSKIAHARFLTPIAPHPEVVGMPATSIGEMRGILRQLGGQRALIKAPFSTAGRGRILLGESGVPTGSQEAWIRRTLADQKAVLVEPWLDRVFDFSIQYDRLADGTLKRRALIHLANSARGQFVSATARPRFTDGLPEILRRAIFSTSRTRKGNLLEYLDETLEPALQELLAGHGYHGPLGVDAFYYRTANGTIALKPVSEINPRFTMGRVAHALSRLSPQNCTTTLTIQKASAPPPENAIALTSPTPAGRRLAAFLTRCP